MGLMSPERSFVLYISGGQRLNKIYKILSEDEEQFVESCISHVKSAYKGRQTSIDFDLCYLTMQSVCSSGKTRKLTACSWKLYYLPFIEKIQ